MVNLVCSCKDFFINYLSEIRDIRTSSFIPKWHTNSGSDLCQGPMIYIWFFVYLAETHRWCFKSWKTTSGTGISLPLIVWMPRYFFTLQILDLPYVGVWLCSVLRCSSVSYKTVWIAFSPTLRICVISHFPLWLINPLPPSWVLPVVY